MKYLRLVLSNTSILAQAMVMVLMLLPASLNAQGVLSNTQVGTIQEEAQLEGYLTISGQRYTYSGELTRVFLNGEEVSDEVLDEGIVVRYTLNGGGVLTRIEILGPINLIKILEED